MNKGWYWLGACVLISVAAAVWVYLDPASVDEDDESEDDE